VSRPGPTADDLRAATAAAGELLGGVPDFAAPVPVMSGDVRSVVLHMATCLHWYAHDLVAGETESPGPVPEWPGDIAPADLVRELGVGAELLARAVALAGPDDRGWHPHGLPDAGGMAAIGIAELLLHTDDVASGTGLPWTPPAGPVLATLVRLFPDAPADGDPWTALRWATGRGDLPRRPRVTGWRYALTPPVRTPRGTTAEPAS
jgi:hypothetical protein